MDVIIIGAGVLGLSTAYHLAHKNKNMAITIIEKEKFHGAGSTAQCTGGIRHQFTHPLHIALTRLSYPYFLYFNKNMGYPIYFRPKGYLFVTTKPEGYATLLQMQQQLSDQSISIELLTHKQIKTRYPILYTDDLLGGSLCSQDAYADPYGVMEGYYKKCLKVGVKMNMDCEVTSVIVQGGQVAGVTTTKCDFKAPVVINAAGPHLHLVAKTAGITLPATPYQRQVYVCAPMAQIPAHTPLIVDYDTGFYLHVEKNGIMLLGGTDRSTRPGLEPVVDQSRLWPFIEAATARIPLLEDARITNIYTGIRSITPDGLGILGATAIEGFYCLGGFGGHGFMHAPALGLITAALVLGEKPPLDVTPLSPLRFIKQEQPGEKALF